MTRRKMVRFVACVRKEMIYQPINGILVAMILTVGVPLSDLRAQQGNANAKPSGKPQGGVGKADTKEGVGGSSAEALSIYADAANLQNNRAYDLAIAEWKKLITKYPTDPIISKAQHYLGVCYMESEVPNYQEAIKAFEIAVKDQKSEMRQETIVNLGFSNYALARESEGNAAEQLPYFKRCRDVMAALLKQYPESDFTDQACFYAGEAEYAMGARDQAVTWYKKLIASAELKASPFRSDAYYSMGVCYEELKQPSVGIDIYDQLLKEFPAYRLVDEVKLRKADLLVQLQKHNEAEAVYAELAAKQGFANAAYALYRQAYCVGQQKRLEESAALYQQVADKFPQSDLAAGSMLSAGQAWFRAGKKEEATKSFEKLISKQDAKAAEASHWLALSAIQNREFERAEQLTRTAMAWQSPPAIATLLKMDLADALYEQAAKVDEANRLYAEIINVDPKSPVAARAAYNLSFSSLQAQQYDRALEWSEFFLKNYPQDPLFADVAYIGAESALLKGDAQGAIDRYTKLLEMDKENPARNLWVLRLNRARNSAGQFDKVISILGPQVDKLPSPTLQAEAHFIVGSSYLFSSNPEAAQQQLQASLDKNAKWAQADEVMLLLATVLAQRGKVQESAQVLQRLLNEYPNSAMRSNAEFRLAQLSAAEGDFNQALERYRKALEAKPDPKLVGYAQYGKAWSLMQQQKYDEAVTELDALITKGEEPAVVVEAKLAKGISLRQAGKLDQAVTALNDFLNSKPEGGRLGDGLYELGLAQTQAKQFSVAAESFRRIQKDQPNYPAMDKVLYELGWALKSQQKDDESVAVFAELTSKSPNSPLAAEAHYHLAQVDYAKGEYAKATEHYQAAALATEPVLKQKAIYKLGWSLYQQDQFEPAGEKFAQLAKEFPESAMIVPALFMSGECRFRQDQFAPALEFYRQARAALEKLSDRSPVPAQVQVLTYLHGSQCLREAKLWPEMQTWLQVILDRYSDSPFIAQTMYELAFCYQNQNQTAEAIKAYSEVADKYRSEVAARSRFMLGELYFGQRDFSKAIPQFQRVMYGYGGESAVPEIKNWQARSGFEAGRCSEVLIADLKGEKREKAIKIASEFYQYILDKHPQHEIAAQAKTRLEALKQL